jgi:hypothetical protein
MSPIVAQIPYFLNRAEPTIVASIAVIWRMHGKNVALVF